MQSPRLSDLVADTAVDIRTILDYPCDKGKKIDQLVHRYHFGDNETSFSDEQLAAFIALVEICLEKSSK